MNATTTTAIPSMHARGLAFMLASATCFVGNVLLIRAVSAIEPVNVWLAVTIRFSAGLAVLAVLYRGKVQVGRLFRNSRLLGRGIVGGLSTCAFYLCIVHLGAGRATFMGNTYVIFAALLAVPMLGERLRTSVVVSTIAALAGLALLTDAFGQSRVTGIYDALAIGTALAAAYVVVTIRQLHATENTATIFAAQCVFGLPPCLLFLGLNPTGASPLAWTVMIAAGVLVAGGQLFMTRAYRDLPVGEGSILQMLVPVGVALGGIMFFNEHFLLPEITGAVLVLGGTAFTALRR
jgi:drug/metabolite transporter (DMT)-like permease